MLQILAEASPRFLYQLFSRVLPRARQEILHWTGSALAIPDVELRRQALASLRDKRFHADGGCVYAALAPSGPADLVRLIVALQTISDYLDNLCDRTGEWNEDRFTALHQAMRDAVVPGAPVRAYYDQAEDDGGYLQALVRTCQREIERLPGYRVAQDHVMWLVDRYCELQQYKHITPNLRRQRLMDWFSQHQRHYPEVHWWEFGAAAGSTLGVFALFAASQRPITETAAQSLLDSYFPWVCGLHILLDYWIDLAEDDEHGDFNFIACYPSWQEAYARLRRFVRESHESARRIGGRLHQHIVCGLLAMYLSDAKARQNPVVRPLRRLVLLSGPRTWMFYGACQLYRRIR
ncbi:tetraprenyl-beta-curcumene synthase family protein [Alicyclobacillus kakegawensis]|uniref:tetraprenyl-beta-curcumene synthase family protein n=1 Tax=Alicyclobacillus kakegawensis TaxID=392012 RepID=UPI000834ACC9|nr:tetraprenyl-beta-curcumene synthase family protein [Alicyclobacillus kakegawensis]